MESQDKSYDLSLTKDEATILVTTLQNVPISGVLSQVEQITGKLREILNKLNDLIANE